MELLLHPFLLSLALGLLGSQGPDELRRAPAALSRAEIDVRETDLAHPAVETRSMVLEGRVLLPGGVPASGAVVVTSAGGEAVTDAAGDFRLEVEFALDARELQVTAAHAHQGASLVASARVAVDSAGGVLRTDTLELGAGGSCEPGWLPTFGGHPGTDDLVWALTVYDDGAGGGPALYVAGQFTMAGGVVAARVARWDGTSWSPLGEGLGPLGTGHTATVYALAVYDDGGGPALYAGGSFASSGGGGPDRIAKWDGTSWSALPAVPNSTVQALAVHDDGAGAGPALYAAGSFTSAGGVAADRIARWDGASWSPLGDGTNNRIYALAVHDDGTGGGPALYAAGEFTSAGGGSASRVARWDGASWSSLGSGMDDRVRALTVYDDGAGGGPALYAGGDFTSAGGLSANLVARWDGASWSALGNGIGGGQTFVFALAVHDDGAGGGPALYAGGRFTSAGGMGADSVARWDGTSWSAVGSGSSDVMALAGYDDGAGTDLYAGGSFFSAGGTSVTGIARWDGTSWSPLGSGLNAEASALAEHDDGTGGGPALYAGGYFTGANGVSVDRIAKWDGASWSPLGSGMNSPVSALAVYDDGAGGGPALYAGGGFTGAGGVGASRIARWDGAAWSALGSGMNGTVQALTVHDDGGGPALFAAGWFTSAGGASANRIARWDGASWSALGVGLNSTAYSLLAHDDGGGHGPALYVGGGFWGAGGVSANHVARWDGASWSALGAGMNDDVLALAVYDDGAGGGPALYAGGHFTTAGGMTANHIARWDGGSWSPLGSGMDYSVYALAVHDDGTGGGLALYAGGTFFTAGGVPASRIARWDGTSWSALGGELNGTVRALTVYDDGAGAGPTPCAAGDFTTSPAFDSYVARWGGCSDSGIATPFCFGDGSGTPCPCGNSGGTGEGCANSTGAGAALSASGSASVGAGDLVLSGLGLVPSQPGLYFQGDVRVNGGDGAAFGDGLRCAGSGVVRLEVRVADGSGASSTAVDVAATGGVSPGDTKTYQLWYRDPAPSPCSSGFNLTNGLELSWAP